jgi:hypothetical protein
MTLHDASKFSGALAKNAGLQLDAGVVAHFALEVAVPSLARLLNGAESERSFTDGRWDASLNPLSSTQHFRRSRK